MAWVTRLGLSLTVYYRLMHTTQSGPLRVAWVTVYTARIRLQAHAHYTVRATANGLGHSIQPGLDYRLMHTTQSGPLRMTWATVYIAWIRLQAHAHYTVYATANGLDHSIYSLD